MMIRGYKIGGRIIAAVLGILFVIGTLTFGVTQCDKRRNEAAQSRVNEGQAGAAQESGADAIGRVSNRAASAQAGEDLTRANADDIRNAPGASDRVNSGVDQAGRAAICRRPSYANTPQCARFKEQR